MEDLIQYSKYIEFNIMEFDGIWYGLENRETEERGKGQCGQHLKYLHWRKLFCSFTIRNKNLIFNYL